ncbi:type VI secretion system contractile sheath small subunit [Rhodovibrio sodomensis]|uniref:type VI secretion system contractile sheath small subunit n=1 Tax=Rhodovibrio sodomensis TaxID=1088 RepID=UPI001902DA88|nr:type VI secretion system contractile sheath small subunit [Rhodovibrio sodomensis]
MSESLQEKLGRVRKPRVHITYDVETGGAIEMKELPFIVGIMANLSGQPEDPDSVPPLKERKFTEIDRDNFGDIMHKAQPRCVVNVPNRLAGDGETTSVELTFESIDDFLPNRIVEQVPALKELLESRQRLSDLKSKLDGNDPLAKLLNSAVEQTESRKSLKSDVQKQVTAAGAGGKSGGKSGGAKGGGKAGGEGGDS